MTPEPKRPEPISQARPKGVLSVLVGNTPEVRGELADRLFRRHPGAVALSISVQAGTTGPYPVVQRLTTTEPSSIDKDAEGLFGDDGQPDGDPATGPECTAKGQAGRTRSSRTSLGREAWSEWLDPLFSHTEAY